METTGRSRIVGIGAHLPQTRVFSDELMREVNSERFGIPTNYISRHIGIVERRVAKTEENPSDLATLASDSALRDAGVTADEIDLIIYTGITRDYEEPSTAHNVQRKLGASNASCMDVSNACLGFMSGMSVADAYIRSNLADCVLVCSGEHSTETMEMFIPALKRTKDKSEFKKMIGALTVGDAGGAMVLHRSESEDAGWHWFKSESDGAHSELCYYKKSLGSYTGQMIMDKICALTIKRHASLFEVSKRRIDWFGRGASKTYCHQVGSAPHRILLDKFGIDKDQAPITYNLFGNLTTTTIPVLMERHRPSRGEKIQFFCSGSGISVFQGGMTF